MDAASLANLLPGYTPSNITLGGLAQFYVENADLQIGPWVIGTCIELFLQEGQELTGCSDEMKIQTLTHFPPPILPLLPGILVMQTSNYLSFEDPKGHPLRFVWLVLVLNVLCLIKSAHNIRIVWDVMVANYANPDMSVALLAVSWTSYTTALSTAIIAIYVQAFFVYRYYMLSRRWYLCVFMALGMTLSLLAAIMVVYYMPQILHEKIRMWSLIHFVSAIVVDTLITACTAWHLYRQKANVRSTAELINRLIRLVWQSALPPTICVIVNAAVLETRPIEVTHLIFNFILPKLYAISLLYTLNSRNEIRSQQTSPLTTGFQITSGGGGGTGAGGGEGRPWPTIHSMLTETTTGRITVSTRTIDEGDEQARRVSLRLEDYEMDMKSGTPHSADSDGKRERSAV
ncbi:hypothetical protein FRC17_008309 [Serendipita sp. 399]|nr:hypothetical protein FRC17_008309 [Serendipita sp. 399]